MDAGDDTARGRLWALRGATPATAPPEPATWVPGRTGAGAGGADAGDAGTDGLQGAELGPGADDADDADDGADDADDADDGAHGARGADDGADGGVDDGADDGADGGADDGADGGADGGAAADARDVEARVTAALRGASTAYVDTYGSPLAREVPARARRRWAIPVRLALTAGVALALVAGGVAVRAATVSHAPVRPVELPEAGTTAGAAPAPGAGSEADGRGGSGASGATRSPTGPATVGAAAPAVVHVVGEVVHPGLVTLAAGARVADAITAAGGPTSTADLAALNLARPVVDGEQVVVPAPGQPATEVGEPAGATGPAGGSGGSGPAVVDVNSADAAALDALPGIGPVLAARIVEWRVAHGRFSTVDELGEVAGIGPTLLARLRSQVRV